MGASEPHSEATQMTEIVYTNVFVWFIVFAIVGALLRRMWALLWGFAVAFIIAGVQVRQYSDLLFLGAIVCAIIGIPFLVRDYRLTKSDDAIKKLEQDNRLAQIEHVQLLGWTSPRVKKKD